MRRYELVVLPNGRGYKAERLSKSGKVMSECGPFKTLTQLREEIHDRGYQLATPINKPENPKVGDFWRDPDPFVRAKPWYVQFPKGTQGFSTKAMAERVSRYLLTRKEGSE